MKLGLSVILYLAMTDFFPQAFHHLLSDKYGASSNFFGPQFLYYKMRRQKGPF